MPACASGSQELPGGDFRELAHFLSARVTDGIVLLTSRVSVEMVQKAAVAGAPIVVAVSAPTALALETAQQAGITLVAVARADGFEVFTHPHRIADALPSRHKAEIEHAA